MASKSMRIIRKKNVEKIQKSDFSKRSAKLVYTSKDRAFLSEEYPGVPPFTRGVYPSMYRTRLWTMRQYAGFGNAKETNLRFRSLVASGQTGLSVAFDLPTQLGFDADHPMSRGEVGRVGVSISSLKDMEELFSQLDLSKLSTSMTINATAMILLAFYIAAGQKQKVSQKQLSGTVQNDIFKEYFARGTYIFPPEPSLKLTADIIEYCAANLPRFNPISISGYHLREAGCTAAEELAFTFCNAIAYADAVLERGISFDNFGSQLSFFFSCDRDFFEEIAKFRAARKLWSHITQTRYKAKTEESMRLRFHVQTAGSTLTSQQTENNIVRVTYQALAAILGGTQSLHTNSKDEALGLPTQDAAVTALRTQQILAYETGVADTIDPIGGSYYIESQTQQLFLDAKKILDDLLQEGGSIEAVTSGSIVQKISQHAYEMQKDIDSGVKKIVGVNCFVADEPASSVFRVDKRSEELAKKNLRELRKKRNNTHVQKALNNIDEFAKAKKNLFPAVLEAAKAYATLGEISAILRKNYGEFRANMKF